MRLSIKEETSRVDMRCPSIVCIRKLAKAEAKELALVRAGPDTSIGPTLYHLEHPCHLGLQIRQAVRIEIARDRSRTDRYFGLLPNDTELRRSMNTQSRRTDMDDCRTTICQDHDSRSFSTMSCSSSKDIPYLDTRIFMTLARHLEYRHDGHLP